MIYSSFIQFLTGAASGENFAKIIASCRRTNFISLKPTRRQEDFDINLVYILFLVCNAKLINFTNLNSQSLCLYLLKIHIKIQ